MSTTFQCPACGGIIEYSSNNQDMTCPFCGTAITTPGAGSSVATVVMAKAESAESVADDSNKTFVLPSRFKNSAEIMDEVKRLLRDGNKDGALKVYSKEFNVPMTDAQTSVDQIEIDMKHSGKEATPAPEPAPAPEPVHSSAPVANSAPAQSIPASDILDAAVSGETKSNATRNWIIGCSIAFVLFCCLCVVLPLVISVATGAMGNN